MGSTRVLVSLVAVVILLPACRSQEQVAGGNGGPSIRVASPTDGADVTSPVDLVIEVDGAEIGSPDTGAMHFHVYIGDTGEYDVVTTTTASVSVPAGQHSLRVVLAQPNHEETDTVATVRVNVLGEGEAATGGGGGYGRYGDEEE